MVWKRYVAIGDSFTEGIGDPRPVGRDRGWADRVAEVLAARDPGFGYANLAIRGRKIPEIIAEQVPRAVALQPDLVSLAGGINDALRRHWDLTAMAENLRRGMEQLSGTGADVLIVTYGRPSGRSRLMASVEGRLSDYRDVTYELADEFGARVVDFWDYPVLNDQRFWSDDRLHLNSVGHERVAGAVLQTLGIEPARPWDAPLPAVRPAPPWVRVGRDATWLGRHLAPWLGRRLAGRSSGDGVVAKRPDCLPV